jgi:hypothetical protein
MNGPLLPREQTGNFLEELMIRRNRLVQVCVLYLALSGFASAQNSNSGDIRGTVTDSTGAL